MGNPVPLPDPTLRERRERTVALLCEHFAQDRLSIEELERRIDVAERAREPAELAALLQDITVPAPSAAASVPEPAARPAPVPYTGDRAANSAILAVMGGVERRGAWQPAARTYVIGLMGGVDLDFREVALPPGETELFVLALMGGIDIVVPPDLAVDVSGIAIMGGFEHRDVSRSLPPDAPRLRVRGLALMGGVDVQVRQPGESAKDARRRLREEQRARRRLGGG
ncbi:MAG TPA: LiaF domain-containing protein [Longimicrobiales bacterium]|nr:LiaF domain-containing protein [Longimicrobiales bacterium]